jgi:hypothetical protein
MRIISSWTRKNRSAFVMTGATAGLGAQVLGRVAADPGTRVLGGTRGGGL